MFAIVLLSFCMKQHQIFLKKQDVEYEQKYAQLCTFTTYSCLITVAMYGSGKAFCFKNQEYFLMKQSIGQGSFKFQFWGHFGNDRVIADHISIVFDLEIELNLISIQIEQAMLGWCN